MIRDLIYNELYIFFYNSYLDNYAICNMALVRVVFYAKKILILTMFTSII